MKRRNLQQATTMIKVALAMNDVKRAVAVAEQFKITPKEFGKIVRDIEKYLGREVGVQ